MPAQVASRDGLPIVYETRGSGSPALVFVHGWSCDRGYWHEQMASFADRRQTVALDLAGHGESGLGRSDWTMGAFGEDVDAVVRGLDLAELVLVGHSMGGDVIVEAARTLGTRVRGLVWVDTYDDLDVASSPEDVSAFLARLRKDFPATVREFVGTMFLPGADPSLVERVSADMAAAPPAIAVEVAGSALDNGRVIAGLLHDVQASLVAINTGWLGTEAGSLARHGIDTVLLPDLGHFAFLEDPPRFDRVLAEVVDRLVSGAGR